MNLKNFPFSNYTLIGIVTSSIALFFMAFAIYQGSANFSTEVSASNFNLKNANKIQIENVNNSDNFKNSDNSKIANVNIDIYKDGDLSKNIVNESFFNSLIETHNESAKYRKVNQSANFTIKSNKEFERKSNEIEKLTNEVFINTSLCNTLENNSSNEIWILQNLNNNDEIFVGGAIVNLNMTFKYNLDIDLPKCKKSYSLFIVRDKVDNINLDLLSIRAGLFNNGLKIINNDFYEFFTGKRDDKKTNIYSYNCGNNVIAPNSIEFFDYTNSTTVENYCFDHIKSETMVFKSLIGCNLWAEIGSEDGTCSSTNIKQNYLIWWLQKIPGANNNLHYSPYRIDNLWKIFDNEGENFMRKNIYLDYSTNNTNPKLVYDELSHTFFINLNKSYLNKSMKIFVGYDDKVNNQLLTINNITDYDLILAQPIPNVFFEKDPKRYSFNIEINNNLYTLSNTDFITAMDSSKVNVEIMKPDINDPSVVKFEHKK